MSKRKSCRAEAQQPLSTLYGKGTAVFQQKQNIMKNQRVSDMLGVIAVIAIFAGCVEGLDGGLTLWTVGCLAVAGIFGWMSKKMEGAK